MSQLVEVQSVNQALAAPEGSAFHYDIDPSDVLIPRILLGQLTSESVGEGKVSQGSLFRSTSLETLAKAGEKLHIIPINLTKTWVISEKVGNKYDFRRIEPHTAANAKSDWFWQEDGKEMKREASLNVFCLLPRDIEGEREMVRMAREEGEIPDLDKALLPVVLSFKSTSYKAGKLLTTHFTKAGQYNLPAFISTFAVSTVFKNDDKGRYYILEVESAGKTDRSYLDVCKSWHTVVSSHNVRVDEASFEDEPASAPGAVQANGKIEF